jgi:predicted nucleic acid-binding protein
MDSAFLAKDGSLHSKNRPAIYFDSSVLIDYWLSVDFFTEADKWIEIALRREKETAEVLKKVIFNKREFPTAEIREKLCIGKAKGFAVISPLSLLELIEWQADHGLRDAISHYLGHWTVARRNKKQIGDYLNKFFEMRKIEISKFRSKKKEKLDSSVLAELMSLTWLDSNFATCHGFKGLLLADIKGFNLSFSNAWMVPSAYSYLQLGLADIMHILIAEHLKCDYIASYDQDFKRAKSIIEEETKLKVLTSASEILNHI